MNNFKLGSSKSFGDGKGVAPGNIGANFWGHDILKFDGSTKDKEKLLKVVKNYVRILTELDIPVRYSRKGKDQSYTDGKEITISSVVLPDMLDSTIGLGLHEASHIAKTDFKILKDLVTKKKVDPKYHDYIPIIKDLFNWVEDRRIDWWAIHKSPGFEKYYVVLYERYFYSDKVLKILEQKNKNVQEKVDNYLFYIINSLHPAVKMTELKGLPEIKEIIDLDNLNRWTKTKDTLDIAFKIFDVIMKYVDFSKDDEEEDKENGNCEGSASGKSIIIIEDGDVEEKPDKKDSDNTADGDGDKEDENSSEQAEEEGNTGGNGDTEDGGEPMTGEELTEAIREALQRQKSFLDGEPIDEDGELVKEEMDESEAKLQDILSSASSKIETINVAEINGTGNQSFEILVVNKIDLKAIKSKLYCIFDPEPIAKNKTFIDRGFSLGTMLGKKLKIRNDKKILRTVKLKKGKIDKRNLHSAGYGSQNIFYNVKEDKFNDVAIHISVDVSGSMDDGGKWENTLVAIIAICKAASMIKGIRVQLSFRYSDIEWNGWTIVRDYPTVINFYDSAYDNINKLKYLIHLEPNGGTPEGLCFEALRREIMLPILNKDTLFINFSDGVPMMSGMSTDLGVKITKNVIARYRASGLSILSYFITETTRNNPTVIKNFTTMYGKDASFVDVNSLVELSKTINNKLLKLGHK